MGQTIFAKIQFRIKQNWPTPRSVSTCENKSFYWNNWIWNEKTFDRLSTRRIQITSIIQKVRSVQNHVAIFDLIPTRSCDAVVVHQKFVRTEDGSNDGPVSEARASKEHKLTSGSRPIDSKRVWLESGCKFKKKDFWTNYLNFEQGLPWSFQGGACKQKAQPQNTLLFWCILLNFDFLQSFFTILTGNYRDVQWWIRRYSPTRLFPRSLSFVVKR